MDRETKWLDHYNALRDFVESEGHFPPKHTILSNWVKYQRRRMRDGIMPENELELFQKLAETRSRKYGISSKGKYTDLFIDFDDTLYDTRGAAIISLKELYEEMRFADVLTSEQLFYERYWHHNTNLWTRYGAGDITRDFLIVERFRRPLVEAAKDDGAWATREFCLKVSDRFLDLCSQKSGVVEGAHELMDYLKGEGYRLHLCSNGFHEVQYKKLRACGLLEHFDTIVLSEDAGANKPSAAFFDYAFKVTGADRQRTLMIGDNYGSDIVGAMNSGLDTILFNRWQMKEFDRHPTWQVRKLKQIMMIL